jgi:hypothetical protein
MEVDDPLDHFHDVQRSVLRCHGVRRGPRQALGDVLVNSMSMDEGAEDTVPSVVGVHFSSGVAYIAVVECPDRPLMNDPAERIIPAEHLAGLGVYAGSISAASSSETAFSREWVLETVPRIHPCRDGR